MATVTGPKYPIAVSHAAGELDVCSLCDSSPHELGCPEHPHFDDDGVAYSLVDAEDDAGPASHWVNDTFAAAARDAGLDEKAALAEGVSEFRAALDRGELILARRGIRKI